jgi:hypothetical protein
MIIHEYDLRFVSSLLFWNFECEVRVIMSFHEFSDEELLSSVEEVELDKIGQNKKAEYIGTSLRQWSTPTGYQPLEHSLVTRDDSLLMTH